ncbi:uncharacterized protein BDR25DRAFT_370173 [Lindgomyces ingoldianus]|uniref:Uncharacterized protein n=1 Tax=Lindgomyces ingoldianus TaxID=673940 RepID=A0ACB6QU97_9PLEO|nr:uncharacterized protein BDR25DRAFT_370173 [Lindgomyces ingoldianus]KAF2470153.1 hypothetical protein BDR25DRAFT_370173 [Lindgomyces ingoldianus]
MAIKYLILLSRQGKVRLAKWFTTLAPKDKAKIVKDVSQLVLARRTRMCNFLEYKDTKIVYRRYASLFFIAGCDSTDNELITLEIVHRYVEQMDKYYGNVCELDIIFNFQKAYFILDELLLAGEMQESSKKNVLRCIGQQDSLEDMEYLDLIGLKEVDQALEFDTESYSIMGSCDAYSTKPARDHKELYCRIEKTLEEKYNSLVASIDQLPPSIRNTVAPQMNLARNTPFGSFQEKANRRVFAYLIAALNETYSDYDFANTLNPDDFQYETLEKFKFNIEETMRNLRPHLYSSGLPPGAMTPDGTPIWSPRSWEHIDSEMGLAECDIYRWMPAQDPFDGEDGSMWSFHYMLYSKRQKRLCYLYFRCVPRSLSYSPTYPVSLMDRYKHVVRREMNEDEGSSKRAEYWFGDRTKNGLQYGGSGKLDNRVIDHPKEEVVDADEVMYWRDQEETLGLHEYSSAEDDSDVESLRDREMSRDREWSAAHDREWSTSHERQKSTVRSMSQDVTDRMEVSR